MKVHEGSEDALVEVVPLAEVVPDGGLVQPLALVQEGRHVLRGMAEQAVLDEELDSLLRVHVELLPPDGRLLGPCVVLAASTGNEMGLTSRAT